MAGMLGGGQQHQQILSPGQMSQLQLPRAPELPLASLPGVPQGVQAPMINPSYGLGSGAAAGMNDPRSVVRGSEVSAPQSPMGLLQLLTQFQGR